MAAVEEYRAEGGYPDFDDLDIDSSAAFANYIAQLRRDPVGKAHLPPMTLLWWVDGRNYLDRISLWHKLLGGIENSGHVGYDIRPSARQHGHATAMLRAALPELRRLGIDPALVSTDIGNRASRQVIEINGGRLTDQRGERLFFTLPTGHVRAR